MKQNINVRERPILFSSPMVRAIQSRRKTQTRRTIQLRDGWEVGESFDGIPWPTRRRGNELERMPCPYGEPGDRLWVRETWMPFDPDHIIGGIPYAYRASTTQEGEAIRQAYIRTGRDYRWRPSIFMPRAASRIHLQVVAVAVERLQEITNEAIVYEGFEPIRPEVMISTGHLVQVGRYEDSYSTLRGLFSGLWDKINGAGAWASNPWVWVVGFEVVSKQGETNVCA